MYSKSRISATCQNGCSRWVSTTCSREVTLTERSHRHSCARLGLVTTPGNRKQKLTLGLCRADENEMDTDSFRAGKGRRPSHQPPCLREEDQVEEGESTTNARHARSRPAATARARPYGHAGTTADSCDATGIQDPPTRHGGVWRQSRGQIHPPRKRVRRPARSSSGRRRNKHFRRRFPKVEWEYPGSNILYPFSHMSAEGIPEDFARMRRSKSVPLTLETRQAINIIAHCRFYARRVCECINRYLDSTDQSPQASLALLRSIRQELKVDAQAAPAPETAPGTVAVRPVLRSALPPLMVALNGYADAFLFFPPWQRELAYIRATRWVDTQSSGFSEISRDQALQDAIPALKRDLSQKKTRWVDRP